jgi:hypothetical protein
VLSLIHYDTLVLKNRVYRYKYRARNINGWGDFSDPGYIFAADLPSQPEKPRLISVTSTDMTIELFPPKDTGGSDIISFELWRDQGSPNSAFVLVSSYTGASMTHTLKDTIDSMTTGSIYQLKFRAKNVIGYSPFSQVLRVSLSQKIPAPINLRAVLENTGASYITFAWDMVVYPEQPTQGYTVEMLIDSQWIEVKNAKYDQNYLQFTMFGLTAGI